MPSSLTRVLSLTLGFSPRLPVSVCGTGHCFLTRSFSWQCDIRNFGTIISLPITAYPCRQKHLTPIKTYCLDRHFQSSAFLSLLRPSIAQTKTTSTGISTCCPSAYGSRPHLRSRLTLGGRASPGNLSHSVDRILTCLSLLIPAFSLLSAPAVLTICLQRP